MTCLLLAHDAYPRPVAAGGAVLNGAGECTGFLSAGEWGLIETPLWLTSTMQLGRVYDAGVRDRVELHPEVAEEVVIPVVAECDDSFLNDCRRMQVSAADVRAAYDAALASRGQGEPPAEGAVGSGTGMSCLGFKGGMGTASRVTPERARGGGAADDQLRPPRPADRRRPTRRPSRRARSRAHGPAEPDTCIGVVVTDAPVGSADCARLARRVGLGLARTGSTAHHGSGEIFLAASTTARSDREGGWGAW